MIFIDCTGENRIMPQEIDAKGLSRVNRKAQKELTKRKIFETSISLFIEKGYENVSIDYIVSSLGLSKGAFYHHFVSKDAILIEFYNIMIDELVKDLIDTIKKNRDLKNPNLLQIIFDRIGLFCIDKFDILKIMVTQSTKTNITLEDLFIIEISTVLYNILQIDGIKWYKEPKDISRYMSTLLFYEMKLLCMQEEPQNHKKNISNSIRDLLQLFMNGAKAVK
jgi:AcrR family transcriptional regulator